MNILILIDNDNVKYMKYKNILNDIFKKNNVKYKIFISEADLKNLDSITKIKNELIISHSQKNKKNTSDIKMVIECIKNIDLYDKFVIMSNDTDFIPLCIEIHNRNKKCYLCYDNNYNENLKKIYDKTYDLSKYNESIKDSINNLSDSLTNKIKILLDKRFKSDIKSIKLDEFKKIIDENGIDYKKDLTGKKTKLNKFLKKYLHTDYELLYIASLNCFYIKKSDSS